MTPASGAISLLDLHEEVTLTPAVQCSLNDTDIRAMNYTPSYAMSSYYDRTADIGVDFGGATITLSAVGTAYDPGTSDWTQIVVDINWYGRFQTIERFSGSQTTDNYNWSPIANSETSGDYEIKYDVISGSNPSMAPGWAAEGVWTDMLSSGAYYFSITDTTGTGYVSVVDVSLRPNNALGTVKTETQRFDLTCTYDTGEEVAWTTTTQSSVTSGLVTRDQTGMRWNTDGTSDKTITSGSWGNENMPDWCSVTPPSNAGDYEIKYTSFTGNTLDENIGTSGTWYPLSTIRYMLYYAGGTGQRSCSFTITIRELNNASTEVACTCTLTQQWEP